MTDLDDVRLVVEPNRPFDETHAWEVRQQPHPLRRSEKCRTCGLRVWALYDVFGMKGWTRSYSDQPPCEERVRRQQA